ncbi:MAG: sugar phosphate isomerase/epimerase [Eubacteriales bacterium]|nr:sugar phosphate isomerase/epimerase [Eubacteriales bacterium]
MQLSTLTNLCSKRFGDQKAIKWICEAGFDAIDYSMFDITSENAMLNRSDYVSYAKELRVLVEAYGCRFNQAHAPFPSHKPNDEDYNKVIVPYIQKSIEVAGILGAEIVVVHPTHFINHDKEAILEFYRSLQPYCKDYGVKVALENMFGRDKKRDYIVENVCSNPNQLCEFADELDSRYFTVCLDIGHCGLVGQDPCEFIRELGHDRLKALHVHDNNFKEDMHIWPYSSLQDWDGITAALKEINYSGVFTFEADHSMEHYPEELMLDACVFMEKIGRHLISKIV